MIRVLAGSNVLRSLCGGVDAAEWFLSSSSNNKTTASKSDLGQIATNLFAGMLKERIQLVWTLKDYASSDKDQDYSNGRQDGRGLYAVDKVSLPHLWQNNETNMQAYY